jgi:thiamine pyrophosphate-dependent acetolactate synthase large subunit-like protein
MKQGKLTTQMAMRLCLEKLSQNNRGRWKEYAAAAARRRRPTREEKRAAFEHERMTRLLIERLQRMRPPATPVTDDGSSAVDSGAQPAPPHNAWA